MPSPPPRPAPPKPAPNPFRPNLFENDFSFLSDPEHPYILGEELKNLPLGLFDDDRFSVGGELRHRYMNEDNRLRPGSVPGNRRSTYDLWRWRNYLDYRGDLFRLYFETNDAASFNEDLPPLPIDENRFDIQNAFVDVPTFDRDGKPVVIRVGRQELLYGSQHLISPLDWANTRRNFEGLKLFSKGEAWDVDAFLTRPVNSATGNVVRARSRDHADASRTFSGVYATWHEIQNNTVDVYWLWLREQEPVPGFADGSRHTVGLRWAGTHPVKNGCDDVTRLWDWDFEGAYQFGHDDDASGIDRTVQAGFFSGVAGHTWSTLPWQPKLSALYYWGSGDRDPNDNEDNTFCVLFPLGHAYWGILDNLAGQNLIDYSVQAAVKPTAKLTCVAAMHWFDLDSAADRIYNVAGVPVGATGVGTEVGEELDLIATYVFHPNFNVQVGYSWFWYGGVVENSSLRRDDATQFYVQTTLFY
jgi:hypothetical protein